MPSQCTFTLNNPDEIYYSGVDQIEGNVTLKTTNAKKVKQIKIRFKGVTRCGFKHIMRYTDGEPGMEPDSFYWSSKENLFKAETIVHHSGVLAAGTYTWPFSFAITEDCPTSMEGLHGHIRYELSVKIYNETKYKNIFLRPVTVIKKDDLLHLPKENIVPVETIAQSTYCCGITRYSPHFNLKCAFPGYAPGQSLRYVLSVYKKVQGKQYDIEIEFIRQTKYKASHPGKCKKMEETVLYHSEEPGSHQVNQMITDAFYIPPTPPTTKTLYIDIQYFLRVLLSVKCCPRVLTGNLPVPIATVPLKDSLPLPLQRELVAVDSNQQIIIRPSRYRRPEIYKPNFVDNTTEKINRIDNFLPIYPLYSL